MKELIRKLFTFFLIVFMFGGSLLVLGQLLGLVIRNGDLMVKTSQYVGTPTFVCAAITGVLGFIYSYFTRAEKRKEQADKDKSEKNISKVR